MSTTNYQPSKAEVLMLLCLGYHEAEARIPDSKERIRKGFSAVIEVVKGLAQPPSIDIDEFVKSVKAGDSMDELAGRVIAIADAISDTSFYNAVQNSGMLDGLPPPHLPEHHPKFVEAMVAIKHLHDLHGPSAAEDLPETKKWWCQIFKYASSEFKAMAREECERLNLIPKTEFVNDAGEPVYTCQQVADQLGIPVEQVDKQMRENFGDELQFGTIHRVQ